VSGFEGDHRAHAVPEEGTRNIEVRQQFIRKRIHERREATYCALAKSVRSTGQLGRPRVHARWQVLRPESERGDAPASIRKAKQVRAAGRRGSEASQPFAIHGQPLELLHNPLQKPLRPSLRNQQQFPESRFPSFRLAIVFLYALAHRMVFEFAVANQIACSRLKSH
jgi:hypothetical protein